MSAEQQPGKATGGGKKPRKKAATFKQFWNRLLRKDKGKEVPAERTVKRAVAKVAKNLHLKKKERQQVAAVLAAEMHRRATVKEHDVAPDMEHAKAGDEAYPIAVQQGLFSEQAPSEETAFQVDQAALDAAKKAAASTNLEMQRKSFLEKSGGGKGSSTSASTSKSSPTKSWDPKSYGAQPTSIELEKSAVNEIASHALVNMLQQVLIEAQSASLKDSSEKSKKPEDMTPDELIDLRRRDPTAWDALVRENTVVSFAISKPRDDDQKNAKKRKEKAAGKKNPLQFEDTVEVKKAPVGRDYNHNEKKVDERSTLRR